MHAKLFQPFPTLYDPMDCNLPGSSVYGIFQARILEWVAISAGKESACNEGDPDLTPGLGRSPGNGNGNPLQYSCLGNPMDRGGW